MPVNRTLYALVFSLVLSVCVPLHAHAQQVRVKSPVAHPQNEPPRHVLEYLHDRWGVEDGLPVNSVNSILQTRDGYLWLATYDGLARFDGVRFVVFNTGNSEGLPDNRILELKETCDGSLWLRLSDQVARFQHGTFTAIEEGTWVEEDAEGIVWVGTRRGLLRYEHGRLTPFAADVLQTEVTTLIRDRAGRLWVGTKEQGVMGFADDAVITLTTADGLASNHISGLSEDHDGTLWIGNEGGINLYKDGVLAQLPLDDMNWQTGSKYVYHGVEGTSWVETRHGVYRYQAGQMIPVDPEHPAGLRWGWHPQVGLDGALWFVTAHGLYRDGKPVLTIGEATSMQVDHEGSIWVGTRRDGVHRLRPSLFTTYSTPEGLGSPNVYAVFEGRNGALWLGTMGGGLSRLQDGVVTNYGERDGVSEAFVYAILEDRAGTLWVGGAGLCRFEGRRCIPFSTGAEDPGPIFALYEDRQGTLWLGAERGLYGYRDGKWVHYTSEDGLPFDAVRVLYEAHDGALWLGTRGGGVARHLDGRIEAFTTEQGLSSDLVRAIYEDAEGYFWIGTEDRGLNRLDLRGASALRDAAVTVYTRQNGLFDDVVHHILEDAQGRLWMSTNRGIFRVSRDELNALADGKRLTVTSVSYDERDGMRNREANGGVQGAGLKARDGRLWFPTQDGVAVIDPTDVSHSKTSPPVVVERVQAGTEPIAVQGDSVRLSPVQRDFEVAYTGLSFLVPEKVRFRYRLEGYQREWVETGSRRAAFYTNVPPGRYTFRVIAANNEGAWNEAGASLHVTVLPPWWRTGWAYAFYVLLFAAGVLAVDRLQRTRLIWKQRAKALMLEARYKAKAAEEQAALLQELDEMKSRFFVNFSHELRTPITLILGPLHSLRTGAYGPLSPAVQAQLNLMLRNSQRLLRLVNQILDLTRLEARSLELSLRRQDLVAFVGTYVQLFAPLAAYKSIDLSFHSAVEACPAPFDPEQMEKVLANLLSNALKFTPAGGRVTVTVTPGDDQVEIAVEDTGIGIAPEKVPHVFDRFYQADESAVRVQEGTGIGLSLVKELVDLHGGTTHCSSEPGEGSRFIVRLPMPVVCVCEDGPYAEPDFEAERTAQEKRQAPLHAPWGDLWQRAKATAEGGSPDALPVEDDVTTVLVVEDNSDMRAYMRNILAGAYRVLEAGNGGQGLELARKALPDLIITDVMMPVMDGFTLSRALKDDPDTDCIPVILLTARAATADRIEGLQTGADDYVSKPFEAEVLLARVHNLIAQRQRLRERFRQEPPRADASTPPRSDLENRVRQVIQAHLSDPALTVKQLLDELAMSHYQLLRRLREEAGLKPNQLIRTMRLEHAARLLERRAGDISEVAYAVGFNSLSYFSRCFREHFGTTPSAYLEAKSDAPVR